MGTDLSSVCIMFFVLFSLLLQHNEELLAFQIGESSALYLVIQVRFRSGTHTDTQTHGHTHAHNHCCSLLLLCVLWCGSQFVGYVLSDSVSETACAFIGNLVAVVILKVSSQVGWSHLATNPPPLSVRACVCVRALCKRARAFSPV